MKRSIISLLVAGLFAGTAAIAADDAKENVKAEPKTAETSQSRAADPNQKEEMNDAKGAKNDASKQNMHDKGAAAFAKADKDHDGTLDRKEAKKMPNVAKNFDAIDTDKDGTVSLDEVHTYMSAHPSKKGDM
jgi:Ca2+-binding EF-hand superfamily protein